MNGRADARPIDFDAERLLQQANPRLIHPHVPGPALVDCPSQGAPIESVFANK